MRRAQLHRDACDKCGRRNPVSFHVEPEEVGIRGLVGQMQREDGAKKVHRGMAGVLRDARYPGAALWLPPSSWGEAWRAADL